MPDFCFDPPPNFLDPRMAPGFQPEHYPLSGGRIAAPPGATDRHERRCSEFLAAYYAINFAQARILDATEPETSARAALQSALRILEELEDRYAPIGLYAEPIMDRVIYADIHFSRPELLPSCKPTVPRESHIAVPGLEEIPISELTGPVVITRWTDGKTDT